MLALSIRFRKEIGQVKNIFDISCVCASALISLIFVGELVGIGIGTLIAMIGVGRSIVGFNYFFRTFLLKKAGL